MFHGLNLCHAVRIPHKRQVCVQLFSYMSEWFFSDSFITVFQDFPLLLPLTSSDRPRFELRSRAGHLEPKHRRIILLQKILLHQLKCLVIDRQCGRFCSKYATNARSFPYDLGNPLPNVHSLYCFMYGLRRMTRSASSTHFLRLGKVVQTAVDTRERQLFELAVQTDFTQQTGHPVIKRFQLVFFRGEHFLG